MKTRLLLHALVTLGILAVLNGLIWQKERLLAQGTTVLLKLAPVDPRSLMQGDYMALRYEITAPFARDKATPARGRMAVKRDPKGVGIAFRLAEERPLDPDEILLRYHRGSHGDVQLGAESYFFQEGEAERFVTARYGEIKVAPDGGSVLVGLRNEGLEPLPRPEVPAEGR